MEEKIEETQQQDFNFFDIEYFHDIRTLIWKIKNIQNLSIGKEILQEFLQLTTFIQGKYYAKEWEIDYIVSYPELQNSYCLGGDLTHFASIIRSQDKDKLDEYVYLSVESFYSLYQSFDLPCTTIAFVNGQIYGGGFEAALAHDIIISSPTAIFSLPESKFNMFPAMGAYHILYKRLSTHTVDKWLIQASQILATELKEKGIVIDFFDPLIPIIEQIKRYIVSLSQSPFIKHHQKLKKQVFEIKKEDLYHSTTLWKEALLNLHEKDIKKIELLGRAQQVKAIHNIKNH